MKTLARLLQAKQLDRHLLQVHFPTLPNLHLNDWDKRESCWEVYVTQFASFLWTRYKAIVEYNTSKVGLELRKTLDTKWAKKNVWKIICSRRRQYKMVRVDALKMQVDEPASMQSTLITLSNILMSTHHKNLHNLLWYVLINESHWSIHTIIMSSFLLECKRILWVLSH